MLSQSLSPNDGSETYALAVANPSVGNNDVTPAPPAITILQNEDIVNNLMPAPRANTLVQNEGMLNNLAPAPPALAARQNESVVNDEAPAPLNTSASQNEVASQYHASHPEAQTNIANNLASEFASKLEPLTFEQTLKNIKLNIEPTAPLHLCPKTIDLQNKFNDQLFKHKVHYCHYCKERWCDTKDNIDVDNNFECHAHEKTRKLEDVKVRQ